MGRGNGKKVLYYRILWECREKEDVFKVVERLGRGEVKVFISFSEMDIIDDINESNFDGVRGSNVKLKWI